MNRIIFSSFSSKDKDEKRSLVAGITSGPDDFIQEIKKLDHPDPEIRRKLDSFSENTIAGFPLPYGIAPNFIINGEVFHIPMVIEESSVVAAASAAAKFWSARGGFKARVKGVEKVGQIHFYWKAKPDLLKSAFGNLQMLLKAHVQPITASMEKRGGGITGMELFDFSNEIPWLFQIRVYFHTADSMGANFINSCLESMSEAMKDIIPGLFEKTDTGFEILMSILSNYTPSCSVEVSVECAINELEGLSADLSGLKFAQRFYDAVAIAGEDVFRAVTHNKGIFNGIDAVVLATGNDFRAVEAGGHAYAARNGKYSSLSECFVSEETFRLSLEVPLALGTVGGLTSLHPLARWSFDILGKPGAEKLMEIVASAGLANHFSALRALITRGIQSGHMKMHLGNILAFLNASQEESRKAREYFSNRQVVHSQVADFINNIRQHKG